MPQPFRRHGCERRMADRAARALGRLELQNLAEPLRARRGERRIRPFMMKIARGPDCILPALLGRSAVTTAGTATLRAEEFRRGNRPLGGDGMGCRNAHKNAQQKASNIEHRTSNAE